MKKQRKLPQWEKITGFVFGVVFVSVLLALAVIFPEPTATQYATFKTILALSAAGLGGILGGFIQVNGAFQKLTVRAGGALALFIVVFFFTPTPPGDAVASEDKGVKQVIEAGGKGVIHTGKGNINIGK